jgi:spore coat polysaccharide biosynthesis protein SpsF
MRIGALVQARTSSRRLPDKVLREVHGKPLLQYLLERLARVPSLDVVVVATSTTAGDDRVAALAARLGVACHRGDLDDVAGRLLAAAEGHHLDALVRVSGDSPLLDPHLVARGLALFREGEVELVTNVFPRSFPPGQSVEVVATTALRAAHPAMTAEEKEHVTLHLYRDPSRYRIRNFRWEVPVDGLRMVVDDPSDLDACAAAIGRMTQPHWEYGLDELVTLYRETVP